MPFIPKDPSITQEELDRLSAADFEKRGRDPRAWQAYASNLRECARVLWEHTDAAVDEQTRRHGLSVNVVTLMLAGLAIEVLAKAALVQREPGTVLADGVWKERNHNLVALVKKTGVPIEAEEEEVLSQLSGFVEFAGRYPIPSKVEKFTAKLRPAETGKRPTIELPTGTFIPIKTREVFEAVFTRVNERLEEAR